jgi:lactoylglutathione lyase
MNNALFRKVDCIRLFVKDLDEALSFYRTRLGHDLIWRTADAVGLRLPDADSEIVLQTEREGLEADLLVDSVDEAVRQFEAAGGKVIVAPFKIQVGLCAVISDPWGNELVILDMSKGRLITDADGSILGNAKTD